MNAWQAVHVIMWRLQDQKNKKIKQIKYLSDNKNNNEYKQNTAKSFSKYTHNLISQAAVNVFGKTTYWYETTGRFVAAPAWPRLSGTVWDQRHVSSVSPAREALNTNTSHVKWRRQSVKWRAEEWSPVKLLIAENCKWLAHVVSSGGVSKPAQ